MAEKLTVEQIIDAIENLSVKELADLVKALEDRFGVSASAVAVPVAGAPAGQAPAPAEEEEKTSFNVVLVEVGDKRVQVMKELRAITGAGLKEVKEMVSNLPKVIKEDVPKEEAEKIKSKLEAVGAKVELK